jgi:allantoicase|mmetsp:Transcript_83646/g.132211  ORF Transcript_83646/g.132211 Transcript_83646/m.132211 type:complete len:407 (-) Transcript_83646:59-1279(-)
MSSSKPDFCTLTDLASTAIGGQILFATDEWFAPAQMFLDPEPPVFKEGLFTDFGKWMDGWETRRKRTPGHDWCLLKLGAPGTIYGFEVDTAFFTGNNVPAISIQGAWLPDGVEIPEDFVGPSGAFSNTGMMGTAATPGQNKIAKELVSKMSLFDLLPRSPLRPGYPETRLHHFAVKSPKPATHLIINYFPDGGVARLRVYGEVVPPPPPKNPKLKCDFASALKGGAALCWSNEHYGTPSNTVLPNRAPNMGNGWETARNPQRPAVLELGSDGHVDFSYSKDWFVMKLGSRCDIDEIEVDTNHFKGNFPESALIEVCDLPEIMELPILEQKSKFQDQKFCENVGWKPLLKRTKMHPHAQQMFSRGGEESSCLESPGPATHARVTIFPDGGISRIRMYGRAAPLSSKL